MATYPTTIVNPSRGTRESDYSPIISSESEGNYPKVRRVTTKSRKKFTLIYANMPVADYNTLLTFFKANQGVSFTFTNPIDSESYTCIFMQQALERNYQLESTDYVSTTVELEEV